MEQFESRLAEITGADMASKEIKRALLDLGLSDNKLDRSDLAKLRQQIRHNLSGLVGPVLADMVVNEQLQIDKTAKVAIADTIQFVEQSLLGSRTELKQMAGALDSLRRFHRQVLHHIVLTSLSWLVYVFFLAGRHLFGWRGLTAVRWTLLAFSLLVLGYLGSKFVLEYLL